uniref:ATP synthase complex subunit 8 n=1 Tax=Paracheirodon innesi TaxID=42492 RepID=F7UJ15_9TELE|nr:ATP synthase F0 subunit 8 [Paracheirodon innesi]AJW75303.1 ATP synthase F0 subunit 8 [Paracheirodon innesi]ALN96902.1 ATP synthase F0 subunit 8 [Paracheirodon innesi]BAK42229.1 ATPase subunit 8 [Paracheirodon innesi]
MPQLILNPWFFILVVSWLIFLTIIPSKIMKHYFNNEPETSTTRKPKTHAWDWTWH